MWSHVIVRFYSNLIRFRIVCCLGHVVKGIVMYTYSLFIFTPPISVKMTITMHVASAFCTSFLRGGKKSQAGNFTSATIKYNVMYLNTFSGDKRLQKTKTPIICTLWMIDFVTKILLKSSGPDEDNFGLRYLDQRVSKLAENMI